MFLNGILRQASKSLPLLFLIKKVYIAEKNKRSN